MAHKAPFSFTDHEVCAYTPPNTRRGFYYTGTCDADKLPSSADEGDYCVVSKGNSNFSQGSTLIYFGGAWQKIETSNSITIEASIPVEEADISEVYFN